MLLVATPQPLRGQRVTDAISAVLHDSTNDTDEPEAKRGKYIKLTPNQLSQILTSCSSQILTALTPTGRSPASVISPGNSAPTYYNNTKYEEICCGPLSPYMMVQRMN
jgi:hypothetical protein